MTDKSHFSLLSVFIVFMGFNCPHTAQPSSVRFRGEVLSQKSLIIDSINFFDGGSGGNFAELVMLISDLVIVTSGARLEGTCSLIIEI